MKKIKIIIFTLTIFLFSIICVSPITEIYANNEAKESVSSPATNNKETNSKSISSRSGIALDATNFPDANFRIVLANEDINSDGILDSNEVDNIKSLVLNNKSISSLEGIQHFKNLENLYADKNQLTVLDLSQNQKLQYITLSNNKLTSINLGQKNELDTLYIDGNQLVTLDIKQAPVLNKLDADYNQLTTINLRQNIKLTNLDLSRNKLTSIDLTQNTDLTTLYLNYNRFTNLDLIQNTELTDIRLTYNTLTSLNLGRKDKLKTLYVNRNQLTKLNVSQASILTTLYANDNQISNFDATQNTKLVYLNLNYNKLSSFKLGQNNTLENLYVGHNLLTTINLDQLLVLKILDVSTNNLSKLDTSKNRLLSRITFDGNKKLRLLDFRDNRELVSAYHPVQGETILIRIGMLSYQGCEQVPSHTGNIIIDLKESMQILPDGSRQINLSRVISKVLLEQITENSKFYNPTTKILTIPAGHEKQAIAAKDGNTYTFYTDYDKVIEYKVTFVSNGSVYKESIVSANTTTSLPNEPKRDGYTFLGWYSNKELTMKWDFAKDKVTENITLYAGWKKTSKPVKPEEPNKPETPNTSTKPDVPSNPNKSETPKTGDTTTSVLWFMGTLISIGGILLIVNKKYKKY